MYNFPWDNHCLPWVDEIEDAQFLGKSGRETAGVLHNVVVQEPGICVQLLHLCSGRLCDTGVTVAHCRYMVTTTVGNSRGHCYTTSRCYCWLLFCIQLILIWAVAAFTTLLACISQTTGCELHRHTVYMFERAYRLLVSYSNLNRYRSSLLLVMELLPCRTLLIQSKYCMSFSSYRYCPRAFTIFTGSSE